MIRLVQSRKRRLRPKLHWTVGVESLNTRGRRDLTIEELLLYDKMVESDDLGIGNSCQRPCLIYALLTHLLTYLPTSLFRYVF